MRDNYARERMEDLERRLSRLEVDLQDLVGRPWVRIERLSEDVKLPEYKTEDAAGMDLHAFLHEHVTLHAGSTVVIPTGIKIELPKGYEAQVRSRSGMALKGLVVANSPGTIDADYRGEVKVILHNQGQIATIHNGDRIAQLVIAKVEQVFIDEVDELSATERGGNGFGSTGT